MLPAKINTITVLISVPKSLLIPDSPNLIKSETKEAKIDDKIAKNKHFLDSFLFSTYFLSIIKIVPINIKTLDKTSMHIVNASPLLVVSSKKKIINRILVKTKLDLSIWGNFINIS